MRISFITTPLVALFLATACAKSGEQAAQRSATEEAAAAAPSGQGTMGDSLSVPNIAKVAAGSKDHTTLVAALSAANLVDVLATPGPFTVFAPTNAAFDKLPKGTVDDLLKPANKDKLTEILQHHVTTSAFDVDQFADGQDVGMVSAGSERISKKDGATYIGSAKVIASVRAGNGWVHIIDGVLVPTAK